MTVVGFNCRVSNQDQISRVKGGVLDSMSISMLEISCSHKATLHDVVVDGVEVLVSSLELTSANGD